MKLAQKKIELKDGRRCTIRSAHSGDADQMLLHLTTTHKESYQNLNHRSDFWKKISLDREKDILSSFENSQSKLMVVALFEEVIIGGLGFVGRSEEFLSQTGSIGMSIQKKYSNIGVGTHLMTIAIDEVQKMGFHRIELSVRTYNAAGIKLYEKMGFEKVGTLREVAFIDGSYVDEFLYQLIL